LERPATPPPASPTKSRLVSPSKKNQRIPTPPHAPNFEDFWNVHAVNTWNDKHSPQKPLLSPKKIRNALQEDSDSPSSSSLKKTTSPSKKSRAELDAKKDFESRKHQLAEDFLVELDHKITDNKIKDLAALTGGVKFIWSKTLNSTAGRANWRRETTTRRNLDGTTTITQKHHASIELAEKVIDDEERLLNVVAHEFCHLANFMVSGIKDQPHGQQFKAWGSKCSKAFAHRGVNVTTKHSYRIDYKYIWTCTNDACNHEFKRHSKSIDPARHLCGVCRGKLAQTKPVPRKQTAGGPTSYAAFVKATFAGLKAEMVGAAHKDVMAALGKKYREQKAEREAAASLKGVDDVAKALEVVNLDSD
jgi:predicted SprT family Zn-dependent metalloprotease